MVRAKKPCRYKACKGVVHEGKCPIASARGRKGGKNGTSESKARLGDKNGRLTHGKYSGERNCCDTLKSQPHEDSCRHSRHTMRKGKLVLREIRHETNIPTRPEIEWRSEAITTSAVVAYLRGVTGICGGCGESLPAPTSAKVHPKDIMCNPARVICNACE